MRKQISGTSVATALLLVATAVLLCTKLDSLNAAGIRLPPLAALPLEGAFYAGLLYIWSGRLSLRAELLGLPALFAVRMSISAAAGSVVRLMSSAHAHPLAAALSPVWVVWATAAGFAVAAIYLVRDPLLPSGAGDAGRAGRTGSPPPPGKLLFEPGPPVSAALAEAVSASATPRGQEDDASLFRVLDPRPTARQEAQAAPFVQIEGWVTIPTSVLLEQLPAGTKSVQDSVDIPLTLIMPQLREGQIRIPASHLEGVMVPRSATDEEATVELSLEMVVPQLPEESLELPECKAPSWLVEDAGLQDIFFAKV
jgi:hypothetical protein